MADTKLTDQDALTSLASGDFLHVVDVSDTTDDSAGSSKKITANNVTAFGDDRTATLTNKTIDGDDNTVQDLAYSAIKSTSRTGSDVKLVTGTAGTSGDLSQWNADGDLIDSKTPPTGDIIGTSDTQTMTNKTLTSPVINTGVSGTAVLDEDDLASNSNTKVATQQSVKAYVDGQTHDAQRTQEEIEDFAGAMATGNTETGITVTYQDADGTMDYEVAVADATTSGTVELATTAETTTGTDATRAVTPDGLKDGYQGSANVTTLGTIATGVWEGTTVAVDQGGSGQTSYTDGQLLIGNTTGNTLAKATLTAGEGIDVTNGSGTITLAGEDASLTNKGIVELATGAETNTGTDAGRAVTPDGLDDWTGSAQVTTVGTLASGDADAVVTDATTSAKGKIEIATSAETTTGTDATRAVSPDGLAGSDLGKKALEVVCFDYTTDASTGDGKGYVTVPDGIGGMNLVAVHARVITAGVTGTLDIQIHNLSQTADMLTTKITIDTTETGSDTGATPAVIDTNNDDVADWDIIRIDVDAIHSGTASKGLIVTMVFQLP